MEIIQKLGELCHKHYKGCDMKTGDWQYGYDTEVIEMLESDEAIEIIQQEIDRAREEGYTKGVKDGMKGKVFEKIEIDTEVRFSDLKDVIDGKEDAGEFLSNLTK